MRGLEIGTATVRFPLPASHHMRGLETFVFCHFINGFASHHMRGLENSAKTANLTAPASHHMRGLENSYSYWRPK